MGNLATNARNLNTQSIRYHPRSVSDNVLVSVTPCNHEVAGSRFYFASRSLFFLLMCVLLLDRLIESTVVYVQIDYLSVNNESPGVAIAYCRL